MYIQIKELDPVAVAAVEKIKSDHKIKTDAEAVIYAICCYEYFIAALEAVQERADMAEREIIDMEIIFKVLEKLLKQ